MAAIDIFTRSFFIIARSVHTGTCIPAKKWHRFSITWSTCLYYGTNRDHLFSHARCLQDNEWNYTRAGQVFMMLKVRSRNH